MTSGKTVASIALMLCLPNILATASLWFLVRSYNEAGASGPVRGLIDSAAVCLFMAAAYGPLLLVAAVPLAIRLSKTPRFNSLFLAAIWACVFLAVVAAAFFYVVLQSKLELP